MRITILALTASAVIAAPAAATDFTFDVPVSVHNVPMLNSIRVDCAVSVLAAGATGFAADSNVVGRGSTTVEAPGGTFEGTVTVPVENTSVLRSVDARSYSCEMIGAGVSASGSPVTFNSNWSSALQRMTGSGLISQNMFAEGNLR